MAKIHTVEWTPAILPHPVIQLAMHTNWYGLAGDELQEVLKFLNDNEILGGIVGSKHDHHTAPYSLTEEFVSVYRMHPLIPDEVVIRSLASDAVARNDRAARHGRPQGARRREPDRRCPICSIRSDASHPGAITLHNYPKHLQNLTRDDGEHLDLAAVDIFRDRERGVPRYNQFRRLLHKDPVKSFEELTDNPVWREADSARVRERSGEGRPDDRAVRRAAAGGLRLQRDGVPHLRAHGVAAAEERSLLYRRLSRARCTPNSD